MTSAVDRLPGIAGAIGRWFSGKTRTADEPTTRTNTGGGSDEEPVVVWTAAHPLEARIVKGRLESEGIPAAIQGEAMGEILGLAAGGLASTNVMVPKPLADLALSILERDATLDESIHRDT